MDWTLENVDWSEIAEGTIDTLTMLGFSTLFTILIGLPLGIILFLTSRGQLLQNQVFYAIASFVVNILRSVPFIILMILLIPVTKVIVGTSLGVLGAIPPLVIGAAPFFARLVETSLREVDRGVIEAAQSMGASNWQIIWNVLLPESRPGLVAGITITTVALVSYTAMSGVIGGGGLGDLAIRYGYQRFQTDVMIVTVIILLVLVQILQSLGDRLVMRFSRK
ncbi:MULTISPECIES: methionine ABC transporter permease [Brevibacillus]|jgi:D-methionine transport system permease protein|uniref:D-methionine ABC transporter n=1 Tax=Brevibacillus parabrevis TaxID=54914 RepID=A0A4Y3PVS7_BREPA|nr:MULTISPECIES: methionine ABC transporter permease [Brevibacillus]KZE48392.1 metal ABC transporter permease [Brevibacillus parabrevis]MBU8715694.1 ABC transporter permease [Brevibacillus parabrevis]MDH6352632.1 D-methionine transport system permease protein [Brevibacillus sp. 1238]MDR5001727.1 methionine ABC transporter permease [Brevibacillus parabrevis]MED2258007.1 ABC transporter permease [Brevibacillus parabrevis]